MQISSIPTKFPTVFAASAAAGYIRSIPVTTATNGQASLTLGFPPACFTPEAAGGVPPFGQDFNGILNQITAWIQWQNAGALVTYDATFSGEIGGYPQGAILTSAANSAAWWVSSVDNNTTNPDAGGAGWILVQPDLVYAGNPNTHVAGIAANATTGQPPTKLWDSTHSLEWTCITSGNAATAVWITTGGAGAGPYFCGTSAGSVNAHVLTPPPAMQSLVAGTQFSFTVGAGLTNTAAATVTLTGFGIYPARWNGIAGPTALSGEELAAGNDVLCEFDGTYVQILTPAQGTAARAAASSATGTVAAVQGAGSITPGEIMVAVDSAGTVAGSGTVISSLNFTTLTVANTGQTIQPGNYAVDTSGGATTLLLSSFASGIYCFIDPANSWGANNLTLNGNGHSLGPNSANTASTFLCDIGDQQFYVRGASTYWRLC